MRRRHRIPLSTALGTLIVLAAATSVRAETVTLSQVQDALFQTDYAEVVRLVEVARDSDAVIAPPTMRAMLEARIEAYFEMGSQFHEAARQDVIAAADLTEYGDWQPQAFWRYWRPELRGLVVGALTDRMGSYAQRFEVFALDGLQIHLTRVPEDSPLRTEFGEGELADFVIEQANRLLVDMRPEETTRDLRVQSPAQSRATDEQPHGYLHVALVHDPLTERTTIRVRFETAWKAYVGANSLMQEKIQSARDVRRKLIDALEEAVESVWKKERSDAGERWDRNMVEIAQVRLEAFRAFDAALGILDPVSQGEVIEPEQRIATIESGLEALRELDDRTRWFETSIDNAIRFWEEELALLKG